MSNKRPNHMKASLSDDYHGYHIFRSRISGPFSLRIDVGIRFLCREISRKNSSRSKNNNIRKYGVWNMHNDFWKTFHGDFEIVLPNCIQYRRSTHVQSCQFDILRLDSVYVSQKSVRSCCFGISWWKSFYGALFSLPLSCGYENDIIGVLKTKKRSQI